MTNGEPPVTNGFVAEVAGYMGEAEPPYEN